MMLLFVFKEQFVFDPTCMTKFEGSTKNDSLV